MACDLTYRERIKEYQELNAQTVGVKKAAVLFMISVCRSYCHIGLASDRQSHASDALFPFLFPILFLFLSLIHSIFLFNKHGLVQFMLSFNPRGSGSCMDMCWVPESSLPPGWQGLSLDQANCSYFPANLAPPMPNMEKKYLFYYCGVNTCQSPEEFIHIIAESRPAGRFIRHKMGSGGGCPKSRSSGLSLTRLG